MDLNQFLLALRARRKAFVLVLIAHRASTAIAVALVVPKTYVATATLMVDARDEQSMSPTRMSPRERAGYMQTQVDLMLERPRGRPGGARPQARPEAGRARGLRGDTGGIGTIDDWIGAQLLENAQGRQLGEQRADRAVHLQRPAVRGRGRQRLRQGVPGHRAAAAHRADARGGRVVRGADEGPAHPGVRRRRPGSPPTRRRRASTLADERIDVESARLAELSTQLLAARNATYDAADAAQAGAADAAGERRRRSRRFPEVLANAYVSTLKGDLDRAEARLEELSDGARPEPPAVPAHRRRGRRGCARS